MKEAGLMPTKIADLARTIRCVPTARMQHVIAIKLYEATAKGEPIDIINVSQSPQYSNPRADRVPVITPGCIHYVHSAKRLMLPIEKFLMQGFPVHLLDLGANTPREIAAMAGNSMNVRSVFIALLAVLSVVDRAKFNDLLDKAGLLCACLGSHL